MLLYLFGAGESYADRVGVYLKRSGAGSETDASFEMKLQLLPPGGPAAYEDPAVRGAECLRGLVFKCGMTFCDAREAGETTGRCEDWGAHVYPTSLSSPSSKRRKTRCSPSTWR